MSGVRLQVMRIVRPETFTRCESQLDNFYEGCGQALCLMPQGSCLRPHALPLPPVSYQARESKGERGDSKRNEGNVVADVAAVNLPHEIDSALNR